MVDFTEAQSTDEADFGGVRFTDLADFTEARFTDEADFGGARFTGGAAVESVWPPGWITRPAQSGKAITAVVCDGLTVRRRQVLAVIVIVIASFEDAAA